MTIDEISAYVESMGEVLTMRPAPSDGTPEVAWGEGNPSARTPLDGTGSWHPVYGQLGWVCVVQPGPGTSAEMRMLLAQAHDAARRRWERRRTS